MRIIILKTLALFFLINTASAQTLDVGSWNIVNAKYNYNRKLSFFGETQLRSLKFYSNFHYYEYKGGVNYKVQENVIFRCGLLPNL